LRKLPVLGTITQQRTDIESQTIAGPEALLGLAAAKKQRKADARRMTRVARGQVSSNPKKAQQKKKRKKADVSSSEEESDSETDSDSNSEDSEDSEDDDEDHQPSAAQAELVGRTFADISEGEDGMEGKWCVRSVIYSWDQGEVVAHIYPAGGDEPMSTDECEYIGADELLQEDWVSWCH
jgi:hypothetical protein